MSQYLAPRLAGRPPALPHLPRRSTCSQFTTQPEHLQQNNNWCVNVHEAHAFDFNIVSVRERISTSGHSLSWTCLPATVQTPAARAVLLATRRQVISLQFQRSLQLPQLQVPCLLPAAIKQQQELRLETMPHCIASHRQSCRLRQLSSMAGTTATIQTRVCHLYLWLCRPKHRHLPSRLPPQRLPRQQWLERARRRNAGARR